MTSSIEPEVNNIELLSEEDWSTTTGNVYRRSDEVWTMIFEVCERTDRETDRHARRNTSHPSRGDIKTPRQDGFAHDQQWSVLSVGESKLVYSSLILFWYWGQNQYAANV